MDSAPAYVDWIPVAFVVCVAILGVWFWLQRRRAGSQVVTATETLTPAQRRDLALGAPLAYLRGEPWDTYALTGRHARAGVETLQQVWHIDDGDQWRAAVERMLDEANVDEIATILLEHRPPVATGDAREEERLWAQQVAEAAARSGLAAAETAEITDAVPAMLRALQRVRRAGLPDTVTSLHAYNYSRAVNLARWGVAASYVDLDGARQIVRRAGEAADRRFDGWTEFGASYAMGRAVAFELADHASVSGGTTGAEIARQLLSEPESPWITTPWG